MILICLKIFKNFTLKLKSIFKYEKHENRSQIIAKNINQPIFFLFDSPLAREIVTNLPKSRQDNVKKIISKAGQQNIKTEKNDTTKAPETEWLGPFLDNCKDVCSEDLQNIWSKILKGKINGRQNTTIRTMSVLSKINSLEANLFNRFLKYKIGRFVYYEENKMSTGFPTFDEISLLLEIGLVKQMSNVATIIKPQIPNIRVGILGLYYDYLLFVHFNPEQTEVKIPSVFLSNAGLELSQFVNHQRDNSYLSCLSKFLKSQNLQLKAVLRQDEVASFSLTAGVDIN